ncbi:MAG: TIGR04211 family SH3 domain-containing protein [Cellvibrionaceae bacterium]|nr:TIGR04211 family SH3 domain-containing protein [Cellvibrionaceae bacterium]
MIRYLLPLVGLWLFASTAMAQTVYVSDVFFVPVRSGAGAQYRIVHQGIRSGTQMTLLGESSDGEWVNIRTEGGLEGWIQTQYLLREQPARMQLTAAQSRLAAATKRAEDLEAELKKLSSEHNSLAQSSNAQAKESEQYAEELRKIRALSADSINLNQRYQDLLAKYDLTQTEFDAVRAENDRLKSNKTINQWMFGAGLVVFGMFLMLILPAFVRQKRHSDWAN